MMKKPMMTVSHTGKNRYIMLNRHAIIVLGMPKYVCMLVGRDKRSLAFAACKEKHVMSFKVPENYFDSRNSEFRIFSKMFVDKLIKVNNLEREKSHNIEGVYDEKNHLIVFPINVA